jgi:hypothetical protein
VKEEEDKTSSGERAWSRSPAEQERVQAMSDREMDLASSLRELAGASESLSYWRANAITYATLFDLVLLHEELSAKQPSNRLIEPTLKIRSVLPFDDRELADLAERMKMHSDPNFPENPEDVLLVERWRRLLDHCFRDDHLEDPLNAGIALVAVLDEMDAVFNDIV